MTFHYRDWFKPKECDQIVEYALTKPEQKGTTFQSGGQTVSEIRECEIRWLYTFDPVMRDVAAKIQHLWLDSNMKCFGMRDMWGFTDLQFTTYRGESQGHYDFHQDCHVPNVMGDRRLSMTLLLSDPNDFEGGMFEMKPKLSGDCLGKKGDVLFFRSEIPHRVCPVTSGVRHSLVTWFFGAKT